MIINSTVFGGGTKLNCQIIDFTLATHQSTNVTLGQLSDEAYAHINDDGFAVALICVDGSLLVTNDEFRVITSNVASSPLVGSYPAYGAGQRKSSATGVQTQPCYYQPKETNNSTSLGGIGKIWHDGKNLMYKSGGYFLGAGTYRIVITW